MRKRKLTKVVYLRLTAEQLRVVDSSVEQTGLTRSQLLRRAVLGLEIRTPSHHQLRRELIAQLSRIGNNLNQLARHANTTGELTMQADLAEVLEQIRSAIEDLVET